MNVGVYERPHDDSRGSYIHCAVGVHRYLNLINGIWKINLFEEYPLKCVVWRKKNASYDKNTKWLYVLKRLCKRIEDGKSTSKKMCT